MFLAFQVYMLLKTYLNLSRKKKLNGDVLNWSLRLLLRKGKRRCQLALSPFQRMVKESGPWSHE